MDNLDNTLNALEKKLDLPIDVFMSAVGNFRPAIRGALLSIQIETPICSSIVSKNFKNIIFLR